VIVGPRYNDEDPAVAAAYDHEPEEEAMADETPTISAEELAEYRRSDVWKLAQAEEVLGNLGWTWDEDEGAWT